jgi:hypothetical protein
MTHREMRYAYKTVLRKRGAVAAGSFTHGLHTLRGKPLMVARLIAFQDAGHVSEPKIRSKWHTLRHVHPLLGNSHKIQHTIC